MFVIAHLGLKFQFCPERKTEVEKVDMPPEEEEEMTDDEDWEIDSRMVMWPQEELESGRYKLRC